MPEGFSVCGESGLLKEIVSRRSLGTELQRLFFIEANAQDAVKSCHLDDRQGLFLKGKKDERTVFFMGFFRGKKEDAKPCATQIVYSCKVEQEHEVAFLQKLCEFFFQ